MNGRKGREGRILTSNVLGPAYILLGCPIFTFPTPLNSKDIPLFPEFPKRIGTLTLLVFADPRILPKIQRTSHPIPASQGALTAGADGCRHGYPVAEMSEVRFEGIIRKYGARRRRSGMEDVEGCLG